MRRWFIFAFCFFGVACDSPKARLEARAKDIRQGIPLRSTPDQVLGYLDAHKVEHSTYQRDAAKGNSIDAILRQDSRWALVYTDYSIEFRFDDQDRLTAKELKSHMTGP